MRKVLLIVPGRLFRDGLKSMLQAANMTIVADCDILADASEVLDGCDQPDLVVVSAQNGDDLGDMTELQALRSRLPGTRWIVLCNMSVANLLRSAVGAGIDSILLQDIPAEILHHVVELVILGHSLVPWELTAHLTSPSEPVPVASPPSAAPPLVDGLAPAEVISHLRPAPEDLAKFGNVPTAMTPDGMHYKSTPARQHALAERPAIPGPPLLSSVQVDSLASRAVKLSEREAEILQCLVNGASNKAIARDLGIAEATVKVHVKALLRKMQLQNRTQAAIWALTNARASKFSAVSPLDSEDCAAMGTTGRRAQDSSQKDLGEGGSPHLNSHP